MNDAAAADRRPRYPHLLRVSHILHGIDFTVPPRRDRWADGPQRHGQDHAVEERARLVRRARAKCASAAL